MRYRRFGKTDLTTSEVGFGCARIGGVFAGRSRAENIALLKDAIEHGITFFDTADMYTQGESERLLGAALEGQRDRIIVATKFGYGVTSGKQVINRVKPLLRPLISRFGLHTRTPRANLGPAPAAAQDFSPVGITRAVEASLRRLRTDYIDIYQLHDPSVEVLRRGEFVETLEGLRQAGKIRYWGVAGQSSAESLAGLELPTIDTIQIGLSVLEQAALDAAIPRAGARGVAVIARQVFASGLVTRDPETLELPDIDYEPEVAARKREQLRQYASIAAQAGRGPAELALQFALAEPDVGVVLLGISRPAQLTEGLRALDRPPLTMRERDELLAARRVGR